MGDLVRAHVFVSGRVQGVFFRASLAQQAQQADLAGWARNASDGRVEAVFEGAREAVDDVLRWCHEGPPMASVEHVEVTWETPGGDAEFRIR